MHMVNNFPTSLQVRMAHSRGPLGRLFSHAGRKNRLDEQVRRRLPTDIARHFLGAEMDGECLCLVMDSSAWAARARYALASIRANLLSLSNPPARELRIRTARASAKASPAEQSRQADGKTPTKISRQSREHVREAAQHIDDPELRAALERLARE